MPPAYRTEKPRPTVESIVAITMSSLPFTTSVGWVIFSR